MTGSGGGLPAQVCAIANGKGGVGKTTLAATMGELAARRLRALAARRGRVLLVDLDPQGNLAHDLGYDADREHGGAELFDAVARRRQLEPTHRDVRPGLDVVAGGDETHALGVWLASQPRADARAPYRLALALAGVADDYDLVLIDCPPGERALQEAALVGSRWLLIPTNADAGSQAGLAQMAARFTTARAANPALDLAGVVLTFVPSTATAIQAQARAEITAAFGGDAGAMCTASIRHAVRPATLARSRGVTVPELADAHPGDHTAAGLASDYHALADELMPRLLQETP